MIDKVEIKKWAIELLDHNPILVFKLQKLDSDLSNLELLEEVIRFLSLVSSSKEILAPSKTVDLVWHEFILFTRLYQEFCESKFGRFIHHTPDDNKETNNRNYFKTIQKYIRHFGEPNVKIWGEFAHQEWVDSQCGSCTS